MSYEYRSILDLDPSYELFQDEDFMEAHVVGQDYSRRFSGAQIRGLEKQERITTDQMLAARIGLNSNYQLPSLSTTNYLGPYVNVIHGLTILDEVCYSLQQQIDAIPPTGAIWGQITGSLTDQLDLVAALEAKEDSIATGDPDYYWAGDKTFKQVAFSELSGAPNMSNYVPKAGFTIITGNKYFINNNGTWFSSADVSGQAFAGNPIKIQGNTATSPYVGFQGTITSQNLEADRTWYLPNKDGVIALTTDFTSLAKATGSDINTGTDDDKYVTSLSIRNSNIFSAEKFGQFSLLTEKTSMLPNDAFVVEDAYTGGAKRLLKWSQLKVINDSLYYGQVPRQFSNGTTEKTSLASNDRLIMEDSADSYAKKSFKWSTVVKTLDSIYYWNTDSQFYSTTEKTTLGDNDIFIIEDAASTPTAYAKKSLKYSTLKTALDSLYGFWSAVTHGIKTNSNVGIGIDATSTEKLKVKGATYIDGTGLSSQYALYVMSEHGINVQTDGNGESSIISYSSGSNTAITGISVGGNAAYLHSESSTSLNCSRESSNTNGLIEIISVNRSTSATAANGIGATIGFYIENSAGNRISPASIGARLSDATSGSEKGELLFYCNSALRVKINKENDFEMESGTDIKFNSSGDGVILKSPNGTSYRVTIDDSGNLIRTAI